MSPTAPRIVRTYDPNARDPLVQSDGPELHHDLWAADAIHTCLGRPMRRHAAMTIALERIRCGQVWEKTITETGQQVRPA